MRLTKLSSQTQQLLAVGVPLVAVILSLFVVYPAWGNYNRLKSQVEQQRVDLNALKAAPIPPPESIVPTSPDVPAEQQQFVGEVNAMATAAGCRLLTLDNAAEDAASGGAVRPVRARVTLEGEFPRLRDFLWRVTHAPRLYVVADLSVTAAGGSQPAGVTPPLQAAIGIERYVTAPTPGVSPSR